MNNGESMEQQNLEVSLRSFLHKYIIHEHANFNRTGEKVWNSPVSTEISRLYHPNSESQVCFPDPTSIH